MRPCFIILDYDFPESISARKLVIESAKAIEHEDDREEEIGQEKGNEK